MLGSLLLEISDLGSSNGRLCMMTLVSLFLIALMILIIYVLYKFFGIWGEDLKPDDGKDGTDEEGPGEDDG